MVEILMVLHSFILVKNEMIIDMYTQLYLMITSCTCLYKYMYLPHDQIAFSITLIVPCPGICCCLEDGLTVSPMTT